MLATQSGGSDLGTRLGSTMVLATQSGGRGDLGTEAWEHRGIDSWGEGGGGGSDLGTRLGSTMVLATQSGGRGGECPGNEAREHRDLGTRLGSTVVLATQSGGRGGGE